MHFFVCVCFCIATWFAQIMSFLATGPLPSTLASEVHTIQFTYCFAILSHRATVNPVCVFFHVGKVWWTTSSLLAPMKASSLLLYSHPQSSLISTSWRYMSCLSPRDCSGSEGVCLLDRCVQTTSSWPRDSKSLSLATRSHT